MQSGGYSLIQFIVMPLCVQINPAKVMLQAKRWY